MYTTQNNFNKNKTHKKSAKLPVFQDDTDLQNFLRRNLEESLQQLIRVSVTTMVKTKLGISIRIIATLNVFPVASERVVLSFE